MVISPFPNHKNSYKSQTVTIPTNKWILRAGTFKGAKRHFKYDTRSERV